jgi:lambda family phage tail tape measure protein
VGAAAIAGAFKEGGFTGSGSDDDVAGVVHANEYVFSAPAVRSIGVENLDALHNGRSLAAAPAGPAARRGGRAGDRPVEIHVNNFSDMSAVNKHIRQNTDAHHAIVEVMRNNWHLISAR